MSLNPELVVVLADGMPFFGWPQIQISASMRQECREFSIVTTEKSTPFVSEFNFAPGTAIQIFAAPIGPGMGALDIARAVAAGAGGTLISFASVVTAARRADRVVGSR